MSIKLDKLSKKYKDHEVVKKISLEIHDGELFSLLGVNGAGKTTTIKMLTGLVKPTSGDAVLNNNSVISNIDKVKKIVNVSPQETAVAGNLSVRENLDFIAGIYEIKDKNKKIEELVKIFNFDKVLNQKAKTLSGGWQRKVSIAMALINDPEIIFLDEPTLGLDVIARRELWKIIESYKGKKTIILTTHYMEEAEMLSDRVAIMVDGNILEVGTPTELKNKYNSKTLEEVFVKVAEGGNK